MARLLPEVFVIRIWLERTSGSGLRRGYVEHIASGQRRYFSELIDALEFVEALGAMPVAATPPGREPDGFSGP